MPVYFQLYVLHLRSCASIPLFLPHAATAFLLRLTGAADRGGALERYFELKLSFTFSCSFAASDPIWLAHRSLQGLSWVAHGQPQLKMWAGLLPQFHWVWLWMVAVLCAVFWVGTWQDSARALCKVKLDMLPREQSSKKHLASQQINGLFYLVQWHFWGEKKKKNPEVLLVSNFSQSKRFTLNHTLISRLDYSQEKHLSW